jgi:hypothetical protein
MYNQDQIQQSMKQVTENQKTYTADSIGQARERWHDARDNAQSLAQTSRDQDALYLARRAEADAKSELDDALKHSSHLVEAKRVADLQAAKEAEKRKEQQDQAAQEKSAYLAQLKERWLVTGGSEHSFNENKESMWTEEVKRRVSSYQSPIEQGAERLRKSGMYGS